MPGHLGSARSGEDVARSPAAILGHIFGGVLMGMIAAINKALGKIKKPKPTSPPPPNGPSRPGV